MTCWRSSGGVRNGFRNGAVPEADAPMVGLMGDGMKGVCGRRSWNGSRGVERAGVAAAGLRHSRGPDAVRSEVVGCLRGVERAGVAAAGLPTPPRSGGGIRRVSAVRARGME
jgi:hypothetical protein